MSKKVMKLCKIGTLSGSLIYLWNHKTTLEKGGIILAMEAKYYDQLHSHYKRLKSCNYWRKYKIDDINEEGRLFLTKLN